MCVYALLSLTVLCCAGRIHTWLTSATTDKPGKGLAAHCYVLLDRSGSMSQMQSAVIEGFGSFVREQAAKEGAMRLTLAQFDSTDADAFAMRTRARKRLARQVRHALDSDLCAL